ncbi:MAG: hypothetical protein H6710_16250 [Myxococcales bacterium]|nr:hypothetical protein [Myxococcales bacterium]
MIDAPRVLLGVLLGLGAAGCNNLAGSSDGSATTTGDPTTTTASSSGSVGVSTSVGASSGAASTDPTAATSGGLFTCGDAPPSECDVFAQDCPAGEKCAPFSDGAGWGEAKCVPVAPDPDMLGEPCTAEDGHSGVDTCDVGALCFFLDDESGEGHCVSLCGGTPRRPSCPEGHECWINSEAVLNLCLQLCDPLDALCLPGTVCIPNGLSPNRATWICDDDDSGDGGALGDPCDFANSCDQGLACVPGYRLEGCPSLDCCALLCDTSQPNTCPNDQACVPWYDPDPAPEGYEHVGFCGAP